MAVCLLFVFLALVQFAYVNVLSRVEKRRKQKSVAGKIALGTPFAMKEANANTDNNDCDEALVDTEKVIIYSLVF